MLSFERKPNDRRPTRQTFPFQTWESYELSRGKKGAYAIALAWPRPRIAAQEDAGQAPPVFERVEGG